MNQDLQPLIRQLLPRKVRRQRILGGQLRGKYIFTSWYNYPRAILGRAEPQLLNWFAKRVKLGETWLDIGAYCGYTSLALCHYVGESGRVFAFEPLISTAGHLAATKTANHLEQLVVVPFALGDVEQLTVQKMCDIRGMAQRGTPQQDGSELVYVIALDQLWEQLCSTNEQISGVKIDVQGMELNVLRGMTSLLRKHRPKLAVEIHSGVNRNELLDLVKSAGYVPEGRPIEPLPGELEAQYYDDKSYEFVPI